MIETIKWWFRIGWYCKVACFGNCIMHTPDGTPYRNFESWVNRKTGEIRRVYWL